MNAIEFDHVSKQYRLGLVSTKTLSHDIRRFWITNVLHKEDPYLKIGETNDRASKGNSEYVWALRDITFNVEQGDVVGIIGKNGAGKSTLLKLSSRVTGPTTGQIRAHGRIGSLLEVGTGFHQEMTGRENIYMNGAILGMTKAEIDRKLDEIIDFSGCERYIDTPVKRYSSGMMVRLGFAVAAHLDPEILVVDEVLAVGDAEFQKKAIGKMQDVSKGEGRTVLFVSHNMDSMLNLCKNGVVMDKGSVVYSGTIFDCVNNYLKDNSVTNIYSSCNDTKQIYVKYVAPVDEKNNVLETASYFFANHVKYEVQVACNDSNFDFHNCVLELSVRTHRNMLMFCSEYNLSKSDFVNGIAKFYVELPSSLLAPGSYLVGNAIHQPNVCVYDNVSQSSSFTILDTNSPYLKYNGVNQGVVYVEPKWVNVKC